MRENWCKRVRHAIEQKAARHGAEEMPLVLARRMNWNKTVEGGRRSLLSRQSKDSNVNKAAMIVEMEMAVFGKWPKSSISYIEEDLDAGRRGATP